MLSYTVTNDTITLVIDGHPYTVPRSSANAEGVLAELRKPYPNEGVLIELSSVRAAITAYGGGTIVLKANDEVTLNGEVLPPILGRRVVDCFEAHVPFDYLLKFYERLQANPSKRAVTELYAFLAHQGMPITPEGHILAYKGVQDDYFSCTGGSIKVLQGEVNAQGRIYNGIGEEIEVQRNSVDDDANRGCSSGLHAGSLQYATGFGSRTVIVSIDPADVVSIPLDCECQKLRCCRYTVVADYKGKLVDGAVRDERNPYGSGCACNRTGVDEAPGLIVGFGVAAVARVDWEDVGYDHGAEDAVDGAPANASRRGPVEGEQELCGRSVDEDDLAEYNAGYVRGYASELP